MIKQTQKQPPQNQQKKIIMNDFIYQPKLNTKKDSESNDSYYCLAEEGDSIDSDNNSICYDENNKRICAKKIIRLNNTIKYLIKTGEDRKLYNPLSIFSQQNKNFLETISRNHNAFKEVNGMAFNLYLRFLKTKNEAYLHQAEREI